MEENKVSFGFLYNGFHSLDFLTTNQSKQLIDFCFANSHKRIMFLHIDRTDIITIQASFLIQEPGNIYFADRKSTRLNSSHANISYAVFCLKKKNKYIMIII